MKPATSIFFIAAFTTISAVAQQDTNQPPAELQSSETQVENLPEEERIQFLIGLHEERKFKDLLKLQKQCMKEKEGQKFLMLDVVLVF